MMFLLIVTVASMVLAAIMSAVAWRIAGDERRRSEARVAALAAEIRADDGADDVGRVLWDPPISRVQGDAPIRRVQKDPAYGTRPLVILGSGALVVGVAIAIAVVSSGRFSGMARSPQATGGATVPASAPATADPLELIALGQERVGDQLTVRGVVRNPPAGAALERLTAVVLMFTPDGGFLASGRADVDAAPLRPGGESTFAITVPRAADVARYRVSFRTDDHVVPHLDRRHES